MVIHDEVSINLQDAVSKAWDIMSQDGLVLAKADVGYSFICTSETAVERIYQLKQRPSSRRCVALATINHLPEMCETPPAILKRLQKLSAITPVAAILPVKYQSRFMRNFDERRLHTLIEDGALCVYLGSGDFFELLAETACSNGTLALGSSANYSNHGNAFRFEDIPSTILEGVDLALPSGTARYINDERYGGTIINLVPGRYGVKRAGINSELIIREFAELVQ